MAKRRRTQCVNKEEKAIVTVLTDTSKLKEATYFG